MPDTVVTIGERAFANAANLTAITFNASLETIGTDAFRGASAVTAITLPSSVTNAFPGAFSNMASLTTATLNGQLGNLGSQFLANCPNLATVTIPEGITQISNDVFLGATKLTSVTLPSTLTRIESSAFENSGLTAITIPSGVTEIGEHAFRGTQITEIALPASVTTLQGLALSRMPQLQSITVAPTNPSYQSIDGVLFNKAGTALVTYPAARPNTAYAVPSAVTTMGGAFVDTVALRSLTVPSGVTTFYPWAYMYATSLREIVVDPANSALRSIDGVVFNKATTQLLFYPAARSDSAYTVPNGIVEIAGYSFSSTAHLRSLTLPATVTDMSATFFQASVTALYFLGNAPDTQEAEFDTPATVYYPRTASGWTNPFAGRPAQAWDPSGDSPTPPAPAPPGPVTPTPQPDGTSETPAPAKLPATKPQVTKSTAKISVVVTAPAAGKLSQLGVATVGAKTMTICKSTATVKKAGSIKAQCPLTSAAKRALRKSSLTVTLTTTLIDATGATYQTTQTVTLKKRKR